MYVVISYREEKNYPEWAPNYDSTFGLTVVDTPKQIADWIVRQISAHPDAQYAHLIASSFEALATYSGTTTTRGADSISVLCPTDDDYEETNDFRWRLHALVKAQLHTLEIERKADEKAAEDKARADKIIKEQEDELATYNKLREKYGGS